MIDLSPSCQPAAPASVAIIQPAAFDHSPGLIQPVADVRAALASRAPVDDCNAEKPLLLTIPVGLRGEVRCLCAFCQMVRKLNEDGMSVTRSIVIAAAAFPRYHWPHKTLRNHYDRWKAQGDWVVLVNRSKAGAAWIEREQGLCDAFLDYAAARCSEFKRGDALPEAIRSLRRQWATGANQRGQVEAIPGYDWANRNAEIVPSGWTPDNLRRQLVKRQKYLKVHKALTHQGIAAARAFVPQVRSTRAGLRFLEEVQFDDVRMDWRIFNPVTGQAEDLWLLIAHDRATARLLGYGMRPASARDDGSQQHLTLADMKQICGLVLERYGLPDYTSVWKIEHGTATLSAGSIAALVEMLGGRVRVSFSSMIGGASPAGYAERGLGNSKGKASLESHNRVGHLIAAGLPGQVGPRYDVRPADLAARESECREIAALASQVPAEYRGDFEYPLLTTEQARKHLANVFNIRNTRTDHRMEGFEEVLDQVGDRIVKRMESPDERAAKLCRGVTFTPVSPDIIASFYEHTQRIVRVTDAGEVEFVSDGRKLTFANPGGAPVAPDTKLLGYFHPDDPRYLHLTTGKGAIVGTWVRRALVRAGDRESLEEAIRYQQAALKTAKEHAAKLASAEADRLTAMRLHNAALVSEHAPIEVGSPVASALKAAPRAVKAAKASRSEDERIAREALES